MMNPLMAADHTQRKAIVPAPVWEVRVYLTGAGASYQLPPVYYASQASAEAAAKEWADHNRASANDAPGAPFQTWSAVAGMLTLVRREVLP